ncbi:MAG: phosphoglycolate phosphatase [Xanthobacteraceae bacterium]|nr:phosphoglycolate phosphatase [Xanthobacteraceae bacterium]
MTSRPAISPLVVFDLDGTLVDTAPDLVATLNVILAREGLPPVDYEAARNMVGGGARVMLERGLAASGKNLPTPAVDALTRDFVEHYAAHIADTSRPFPGVEAALDALAERGCRFAVCTNKLEWLSVRLLDALNLSKRFGAICGSDTFGVSKPDPEILRRTIARASAGNGGAVMVGDSFMDIATARAASIPVIAVDFGYTDTPVAALAPDRVISRFADLPEAVRALVGAPRAEFQTNG